MGRVKGISDSAFLVQRKVAVYRLLGFRKASWNVEDTITCKTFLKQGFWLICKALGLPRHGIPRNDTFLKSFKHFGA